ncbi:hypothetical protein QYE76_032867 [Lolium multiflorum]|uniref:DUF4283 domain-containing protein n=1 Tax=Lolium multiflorum TaxID=4521 RepID=A0AAD8QXP0_LOLMU|nr:hypothetical protein QYE76_032867 [Lolium multiflorum]
MDPACNGGDQGGADEAPTRPKLFAGDLSVPARGRGSKTVCGFVQPEDSNWHSAVPEGLADVEELLEGEVDMEDEDVIELEPEEDEEPATEASRRWRLVGRYLSVRKPDFEDMTDHFNGVWHLRTGVNFAPMGKNWFHVTLFSEEDYDFVARGGQWIYRGYPLLVAKIPEGKRPSETVLNSVPLWVQVYDPPWNRQKKSTVLLVGAKLGKYLEADLGADGYSPYDFLRVRVDILVDKRLRTTVSTQVKGQAEVSTYLLRDGFEENEAEGSSEVDADLAKRITSLSFPLARTDVPEGNGGRHKASKKTVSRGGRNRGQLKTRQGSGIVENLIPLAMFTAYPSSSYLAGLGSEEMIPPLRGLDSFVFSAGDTLMSDADSILCKRSAQHEEDESEDMSKAMVVRDGTSSAGKLKKGKTGAEKVRDLIMKEEVEATSPGTAGQLTGSHDATRQEQ